MKENNKKKHKPNRASGTEKARVQDSIVSKSKEAEVPIIADAGSSMLQRINWRRLAFALGNSYLRLSPLLLTKMIRAAAGDVQCQQSHTEDGDVTDAYIFYSIICQVALAGGYILKPTLLEKTMCDTTSTVDSNPGCRCNPPNGSPRLVTMGSLAAIQGQLSEVYNQSVICNYTNAAATSPVLSAEQLVCGDSSTYRNCLTSMIFGLFHDDRTLVQRGFNNGGFKPDGNATLVLDTMTSVLNGACQQIKDHTAKCKNAGIWTFSAAGGTVLLVVFAVLALCLVGACMGCSGATLDFLSHLFKGSNGRPVHGNSVDADQPLLLVKPQDRDPEVPDEEPDDLELIMNGC